VDGIEAAHPGLSGNGGGEISKTMVAFDYRKAAPVLGREVLAHQSLRGTVDKGEATCHFDLRNVRRHDKVGASNHRARLVRPVLSEVARQQDGTVDVRDHVSPRSSSSIEGALLVAEARGTGAHWPTRVGAVTYQTGLIANRVIREVLTGIAMRKKGITGPYYFADEAIDGGQGQDWPQRR